jgi:hypothetical protein
VKFAVCETGDFEGKDSQFYFWTKTRIECKRTGLEAGHPAGRVQPLRRKTPPWRPLRPGVTRVMLPPGLPGTLARATRQWAQMPGALTPRAVRLEVASASDLRLCSRAGLGSSPRRSLSPPPAADAVGGSCGSDELMMCPPWPRWCAQSYVWRRRPSVVGLWGAKVQAGRRTRPRAETYESRNG